MIKRPTGQRENSIPPSANILVCPRKIVRPKKDDPAVVQPLAVPHLLQVFLEGHTKKQDRPFFCQAFHHSGDAATYACQFHLGKGSCIDIKNRRKAHRRRDLPASHGRGFRVCEAGPLSNIPMPPFGLLPVAGQGFSKTVPIEVGPR